MSIPTNEKRRCYNCRFCYRQDEGYSNYTVENTTMDCLQKKNPHFPRDEGYDREVDDHEFVKVAETCTDYSAGNPLYIDCDRDAIPYKRDPARNDASYYTDDSDVIAAWDFYNRGDSL